MNTAFLLTYLVTTLAVPFHKWITEDVVHRRIVYANAHFGTEVPGWKTDRGRVYITFGPPDKIEAYPQGSTYHRPPEEGGGDTTTYPFEKWHYNQAGGDDADVLLEFVDTTLTGNYRLIPTPPSLHDQPSGLRYLSGSGG